MAALCPEFRSIMRIFENKLSFRLLSLTLLNTSRIFSLSIFPVPYLFQERRHADLLGLHLDHPGMFEHSPRRRPSRRLLLQTTLDEVLEHVSPLDPILGFVLELGNRLCHDISQQVDQSGAGLHLRAVGREGKAMLRDLEERHA